MGFIQDRATVKLLEQLTSRSLPIWSAKQGAQLLHACVAVNPTVALPLALKALLPPDWLTSGVEHRLIALRLRLVSGAVRSAGSALCSSKVIHFDDSRGRCPDMKHHSNRVEAWSMSVTLQYTCTHSANRKQCNLISSS